MGLLRTVNVIGISFEDNVIGLSLKNNDCHWTVKSSNCYRLPFQYVIGLSLKNNDYYRTAIKKKKTLTAISLPFKNSNYKFRRVSSIGLPFIKRCCPWIAI